MRVPVSWLREYVSLDSVALGDNFDGPDGSDDRLAVDRLNAALVRSGLEVEAVHRIGDELRGPIVIGEVRQIVELPGFKKPVRHCQVDVGEAQPRSIVCAAQNFAIGDWVVVSLPGAVLPGGFKITARQTYGQLSDGMICAVDELGIGGRIDGVLVLSRDEFADRCHLGDDAIAPLGLTDVVFELAVTPDRGYCFSMRGVARELSHALEADFTDPAAVAAVPAATSRPPYPVRVDEAAGCDRFAGRVLRGLNPTAPTPWWMQRRLLLSGVRSISLAVDVTNYLMLELGQPMHAYDLAALQGQLVVRRANAGEKLHTLDGVQRVLDPEDLVIADDTGPIGLAAVMGGATTEVSHTTTELLIECAHWDPVTVARTVRRHQLPSEASKRFERGVDTELGPVAAQRAVQLLTQCGGGTPDPDVLDLDSHRPASAIMLNPGLADRVVGVTYGPDVIRSVLEQIGCRVQLGRDAAPRSWSVTPPSWRPDLTDPIDLVEEVVRLRGYDAVPSVLPPAPASPGLSARQRRLRSVSRALAEDGYVEVMSYPFVAADIADVLGLDEDDPRRNACRLLNPLDAAEPQLRTTLLPGLLRALSRNVARGQRDVALFEAGAVYIQEPDAPHAPELGVDYRPSDAEIAQLYAAVPQQPRHFGVALTGDWRRGGWWGSGEPASWADAVEAARTVAVASGVELDVRQATQAPWHPGRCAELVVHGSDGPRVVGYAGELHPRVVQALNVPARTVAMELNLDALPERQIAFGPVLSAFPPALLDVALVVSADTPATAVERALREGAGPLLESVGLFDVFTGEQLGQGRKSLAYALTFRAVDHTLTVEEARAACDAAVEQAARQVGASLRS